MAISPIQVAMLNAIVLMTEQTTESLGSCHAIVDLANASFNIPSATASQDHLPSHRKDNNGPFKCCREVIYTAPPSVMG
jgi:hypothetical protein